MTNREQQGVVLVLVLWMLTLLIIMAGSYSYAMRTETRLTAGVVESARARALAEAGIWLAVADLQHKRQQRQWRADGSRNTITLDDHPITLQVQDETGKIDINTARVELLHALLEKSGLKGNGVIRILHAILDWRDRDNNRRKLGAEDPDYRYSDLDYESKDGPFNSVEELRLVMGMQESVFRQVYPALTIHSRQSGINPEVASREVLLALPGADEDDIDTFLQQRSEDESIDLPGVDTRYFNRSADRVFSITSTSGVGTANSRLDVVVLMNRNASPPFSVLSWREAVADYRSHASKD